MSGAGVGGRAVLLDIEGTTTPIAFVHQVLFPYSRARIEAHLTGEDEAALGAEREADVARGLAPPEGIAAYARWLIDQDRKLGPLKELQGRIWREGYAAGALKATVFPDVPAALASWREGAVAVAIYSSGSVLAQQLLFAHTDHGDLRPWIERWFDTAVGSKREGASYARIAREWGREAAAVTFVSDVSAELDAARAAGMATRLAVRPGNPPQEAGRHPVVRSLLEV